MSSGAKPMPRTLTGRCALHGVEADWPRHSIGLEASSVTARHELSPWIDRRVLDVNGDPVGVIVAIGCDAVSGRPAWLAIDIGGLLAMNVVVAPVRGSSQLGEDVVIAHDHQALVTAPHVALWSILRRADEDILHVHYAKRQRVHDGDTTSRRPGLAPRGRDGADSPFKPYAADPH